MPQICTVDGALRAAQASTVPVQNAKPKVKGEDLGTSIIATVIKGGVVIAADTRTSAGSYITNRESDKIRKIYDNIWCCTSGSAADTETLCDYCNYYLEQHAIETNDLPRVKTAAKLLGRMVHGNPQLLAGMLCAGFDNAKGGQVFSVSLGGTVVEQSWGSSGSGSVFIYGLCDQTWKKDMTKDEGINWVTSALRRAMSRDGSS